MVFVLNGDAMYILSTAIVGAMSRLWQKISVNGFPVSLWIAKFHADCICTQHLDVPLLWFLLLNFAMVYVMGINLKCRNWMDGKWWGECGNDDNIELRKEYHGFILSFLPPPSSPSLYAFTGYTASSSSSSTEISPISVLSGRLFM